LSWQSRNGLTEDSARFHDRSSGCETFLRTGNADVVAKDLESCERLVALLIELKFNEDDATRWAGKARSQGMILISSFERTDTLLRDNGLLA